MHVNASRDFILFPPKEQRGGGRWCAAILFFLLFFPVLQTNALNVRNNILLRVHNTVPSGSSEGVGAFRFFLNNNNNVADRQKTLMMPITRKWDYKQQV